ncbi:MAG: hypothetical protein N2593_00585 [Patescibacteria group bacterium]|nr:hypothetical protein [Patescibacteria group bacterium]
MDNAIKIILKKLDNIENRLKDLENPAPASESTAPKTIKKDPLFSKAVEIMDKYDEISALQLAKELGVDQKRAEEIMDQMEAAGLGTCIMKEI